MRFSDSADAIANSVDGDVRCVQFINSKTVIGILDGRTHDSVMLRMPLYVSMAQYEDGSRAIVFSVVLFGTDDQWIHVNTDNNNTLMRGPYKPTSLIAGAYMEFVKSGQLSETIKILNSERGPKAGCHDDSSAEATECVDKIIKLFQ